jgi:hypothetical protein
MHHGRKQCHRVAEKGFVDADMALGRLIHGPSAILAVNVSLRSVIRRDHCHEQRHPGCRHNQMNEDVETPLTVEVML